MKTYEQLVSDALTRIEEYFPWDLADRLAEGTSDLLLIDIREPYEYAAMHIKGARNVPRGILESACEYGYEETVPELVAAREREVVLICRSGKRSALAADVLRQLGYQNVVSLKTGMRGWSDYEQEMVDADGAVVDEERAIDYFTTRLKPEQQGKLP